MSRARDPHPEAGPPRDKVVRLTPRPKREAESEDAPHFVEMIAATNYSFLRGASHPSDMVAEAIALGHKAIGIVDRNTVAGVVRAYVALKNAREKCAVDAEEKDRAEETAEEAEQRRVVAREAMPIVGAFRLVVGARLCFSDGTPDIVAYPINRHGWGRLTRLLSSGNRKEGVKKGNCDLRLADLLDYAQDMLLIAIADEVDEATLVTLARAVPGSLWLAATMPRGGRDRRRLARLGRLADRIGIPLLATCDALYATPDQRALYDIVSCIREGVTIHDAGRLLQANAERHLKPAREMARLFRDRREAVGAWADLLRRITFTLDHLKYEYPHEPVPEGWEPQAWLEHETLRLAGERYPDGIPDKIRVSLDGEFKLIRDWKYAYYFLTVYDAVKFARSKGILCQGRGSAANSAVCYYLGITSVDPAKHDLLFSRFISEDRDEPPDIDVDFEHERREEVIQHIYQRYGRERAAIAATVIHYRPRSTVREVGKALGLSEDVTTRLTSTVWGSFTRDMEARRYTDNGFDPAAPDIARLRAIVDQLLEFPRHLSQHVGGFVLTQDRLDETVPIHNGAMENRTFIEWDKEDIDALKLMKVDVLALGMLTCIRKGFDLMRLHGLGDHDLTLGGRDDDPAVYDMLCKGDSIGVFQVESRAQINMLPRLQPRIFYDLAIQVAIVRPGPIEGDMVHPYLKRREEAREGKAPTWHFPKPALPHPQNELYGVLGKTFGVPLFQEQAMKLAITAAGFKPSEANQLRRAMATFRNVGTIGNFEEKMVGGMVARGYEQDFAQRCYNQIKGFGSYGFPESHAISFARLVYVSSWLKCFHPAVFACALLNSQPMGFYAPAQIVRDARDHDVEVRAADINASDWDNSLECRAGGDHALRIGLRQIDGFRED
ncbi:MAG: error-prone polymerase, partial [Sphingomonas bacterium]|nr:error-prone polymerase [Sphingomonas bacterium]